jgi:hypothetical protein
MGEIDGNELKGLKDVPVKVGKKKKSITNIY